jgi:hypothetical protein
MSENYEVSQNNCMTLPYFILSVDPIHPACVTLTTQTIFYQCSVSTTGFICNTRKYVGL